MVALRSRPGIGEVVGHQCRYGLATPTHTGQAAPAMKPTRFLSSAPELRSRLGRRCTGDHKHQQLTGGRAREAATYPQGLCRAMLRGIEAQRRREGGGPPVHVTRELDRGCAVYALCKGGPADLSPTLGEVLPEPAEERVIDEAAALEAFAPPRRYWDAVTNEELPLGLTRAARKEELDFMKDWQVWETVPTAACWQATGRAPLQGKWVDVNKGDVANPVVRSRYVAKEFANQRDDEFFAATPPLEALRLLLSHAASGRQTGKGGRKVLVLDARKAHRHAMSERTIYVALPPEVREPGKCALLKRCLYGTRDAPARWEAYLAAELAKMGFMRGAASACCFQHHSRDLRCVVHGDDFVFVGPDDELLWVGAEMRKSFLIKEIGKLGGDADDMQELRVLNRVLRWETWGVRIEADPRHQEILIDGLPAGPRSVSTPGVKERGADAGTLDSCRNLPADSPLTEQEVTAYRSSVARANYLALDRPELAFAAKELCRRMSAPVRSDVAALERLLRYLRDAPRLTYKFAWQAVDDATLEVYVDTDFAGCLQTRRSTSGGGAMRGGHLIKHWSVTQKAVTLSSGEAELCGIVKGAAEALGMQSIGRDLGIELKLRLHTDSSAAAGICRRSGIGRVRHLAVGQLWVQERLREGAFSLTRIAGTENPADLLTKHVNRELVDKHLATFNVERSQGRAESAPRAQL